MAAIEDAGMDGVLQLEGRHDGAGREHVELQAAARHLVDLLGVVDGESWKMSLVGQVDWNFQVTVWARETCGIATVAPLPGRRLA